MGEFIIKMPDVGEGVAEAELVEWHVKPGDPVREDMVLAAVMTDKATVEIPSPVTGKVLWLGAEVGDTVAVKAPLVRIETAGEAGEAAPDSVPEALAEKVLDEPVAVSSRPEAKAPPQPEKPAPKPAPAPREAPDLSAKPLASPAVRLRARESGIDLRQVAGTGPAGSPMRISISSSAVAPSRCRLRPASSARPPSRRSG